VTAWPGERALHGGADAIPLTRGAHLLGEPAGVEQVPGALWLCGKHFVGPDPEAALRRVGATTVVCLCQRHELASRYPDYVTWLRDNQPDRALWSPIPDLGVPAEVERDELLGGLVDRLAAGEGLLLHCGAGLGRAGTLAAALLVVLGFEAAEASAVVAAHRPMAGPQSLEQAEWLAEGSFPTTEAQRGLP